MTPPLASARLLKFLTPAYLAGFMEALNILTFCASLVYKLLESLKIATTRVQLLLLLVPKYPVMSKQPRRQNQEQESIEYGLFIFSKMIILPFYRYLVQLYMLKLVVL